MSSIPMATIDAGSALAWLATYLIHSTLLLGGAWLATRALRTPRLRELVWRTALIGGLATASLQGAIGDGPLALSTADLAGWAGDAAARSGETLKVLGLDPSAIEGAQRELVAPAATNAQRGFVGGAAEPTTLRDVLAGNEPLALSASSAMPAWIAGTWLAWAAFGLARLAVRRRRLAATLSDRRDVPRGPLRELFRELKRSRGPRRTVRLTASSRVGSPLALGLGEICVPEYAASELGPRSHAALLAHELAHLRRADAAWSTLAAVLARLFPFQPLHRVAERRMRAEAELLCDADAVRATGDGAALARCLVEVAERTSPAHRGLAPAWTAAMAAPRSEFVARVEAALRGGAKPPSRSLATATLAAGAVTLAALACAGPGVKDGAQEFAEPGDLEDRIDEFLEERRSAWESDPARSEYVEPAELSGLYAQAAPETVDEEAAELRGLGYIEVSRLPEPDVLLDLDDAGEIRAGGRVLQPAAATDFAPVHEFLKHSAQRLPRVEWEGGPSTLSNGVLRIRATSKTPFTQVQSILQQCGAKDVLIWRLQFEVEQPDGSRSVTPYELPRDVGVHAEPEGVAPRTSIYEVELRGREVTLHMAEGVAEPDWSGTQAELRTLGEFVHVIVLSSSDSRFVIDAKSGTTFGQVDAVVRELLEEGATHLRFVGRFE